jgi:hypothetical protein
MTSYLPTHLLGQFTLLLAFLVSPELFAMQTRVLEISGPAEAKMGELTRLIAEVEPAETPCWIVLSPSDLDFEQVDNGRRLILTPPRYSKEPVVVLLLAQSVVEGRVVTRQIRRQIRIVDESIVPPRNPDDGNVAPQPPGVIPAPPSPQPINPSPPLEQTNMFQTVRAAFAQVKSVSARNKANDVAANFEWLANECEAGRITTIPQIWQTISSRNAAILGADLRDWEPVGRTMQSEFQRLKLADVSSHAVQLRAAALAIRSSSQQNICIGGVCR